jgi:hypothetical protein
VPKLQRGEVGPHPWDLDEPRPEQITLGPGVVDVPTTRVFGAHQTVTVLRGSQLRLGPGASLIFLGRVEFSGTRGAPIELVRAEQAEAWGGLALQGKGAAHSSLSFVKVSGGSRASFRATEYPGMVNVHDTSDVRIGHASFFDNAGEGDVFHTAYVDGLVIEDSRITDATADGFDFEFSTADLRRVDVTRVGDDGIDSMGSKLFIASSTVIDCGGNGLSVGEESDVTVRNSLVARTSVGVLAKNASNVSLSGSVLYDNERGVRVYKRTVRYAGDSSIGANVLFIVGSSKKAVDRDDKKHDVLDLGRVQLSLPQPGVLDHVRDDVLALPDWRKLAQWVETHGEWQSGGTL